jgi:ribonuclease P protein component
MFAKRHRFHGYGSLKSVYNRGQNVRGSLISLKFNQRDPSKKYRVAVVVSRKVSKSAVKRNRIRRRIYEQVRNQAEVIQPGTDLVFTVYSEQVATLDSSKLSEMIGGLLQKTKTTTK